MIAPNDSPDGRVLNALFYGSAPRPESFAFDPAGNLLDPIDRAIGYPALDNRIAVFEDLRFDYDAHGNVTRRRKGAHELAELSWNAEHQLAQSTVTRHGVTQTTRYEYDALGRRIRKRDAFGATEYLWDGDLMIERRRNNKSALFLYEPDSFVPLATVQYNETYWYHCDQIGAPMELTDADGRIVWAADYRVWGEATVRKSGTDGRAVSGHTPAPPPIEQPFRFQGQQFDEETGLHYNRFRYYDPGVGRFVSQDPIGLIGGTNIFNYGPNSLGWIDPLGLECIKQKVDGTRREQETAAELKAQYPNGRVQNEVYLRTENGKRAIDPITGTGRRIDHVVIDNISGGVICCCETTSPTADKREQTDKERRVRENGGTYVRDRQSGELLDVRNKPTRIVRRR